MLKRLRRSRSINLPTARAIYEPLESRRLLSHIVWTNRGDDGFGVFGTQANAARQVVDAAIGLWDQAIIDFNQSGSRNRLDVEINMRTTGTGFGASANITDADSSTQVPREGTIAISRGNDTNGDGVGDGAGWFIDPTPNDSSEFLGNIVNAFVGVAQTGSPADGMRDLLSIVTIEMAHVLGLIGGRNDLAFPGNFATNTGVPDDAHGGGVGTFWAWDSPNVDVLLTSFDSGAGNWGAPVHVAGPRPGGVGLNFSGKTFFGVVDVGNASYGPSRRLLPSNVTTAMLTDAYGYTSRLPNQFGHFYAHLDDSGLLTIRGRDDSDDFIEVIRLSDGRYRIETNIPGEPEGTRPHNNSDTDPYFAVFDASDVTSILIQTGSGNDVVSLRQVQAGDNVRIETGDGDDLIEIGGGDLDTNTPADVSVLGGAGDDTLRLLDGDDTLSDSYTFDVRSLTKSSTSATWRWANSTDNVELRANDSSNDIHINYAGGSTRLSVMAGGGDDTIWYGDHRISGNIHTPVTVNGGAGSDRLLIRDENDTGDDDYTIGASTFVKSDNTDDPLTFFSFETVNLRANHGSNRIEVTHIPAGREVSVRANGGTDTLVLGGGDIDTNISGTMTFIDSPELLVLDDVDDTGSDTYTFTATTFSKTLFSAGLDYTAASSVELRANGFSNTINIRGIAQDIPVSVLGGGGDDTFNIAEGDLDVIRGELFVGGGPGSDTLLIDDSTDLGTDTYDLRNNRLEKQASGGVFAGLRFGTIENTVLEANQVSNQINVRSIQINNSVTVNAGDGNDTIRLGDDGVLLGLVGDLTVDGQAGSDELIIDDSNGTFADDYVLRNAAPFPSTLLEKRFGDVLFRSVSPVSLLAGSGDDTINVGGGNIGIFGAPFHLDGGGGQDTLILDDRDDVGAEDYTLTATSFEKDFFGGLTYAAFQDLILHANDSENQIDVLSTFIGTRTRVNAGDGNDRINVRGEPGLFISTRLTVDAGPGNDDIDVSTSTDEGALVTLAGSQGLNSLTIAATFNGASSVAVEPDGQHVLNVRSLSIGPASGARLDLNDNAMILNYSGSSPLQFVADRIAAGFSGGSWANNGITTSLGNTDEFGLGYAEASDVIGPSGGTFMGHSVDSTAVLVRYTRYGDANLDGVVSLGDLARLRTGFGSSSSLWSSGDFNYDESTNLGDLALLRDNFGLGL